MLTVKYLSLSIFPLKVYVISGRSSLRLVILFPFRSVVICGFRISFRISRAMSFDISRHRSRVVILCNSSPKLLSIKSKYYISSLYNTRLEILIHAFLYPFWWVLLSSLLSLMPKRSSPNNLSFPMSL